MRTRKAGVLMTLLACTALSLGGCQQVPSSPQIGPKTGVGAALGAAGGGLLAAATGGSGAAIAGGVLLGGLAGGALGSVLDDQDRRTAAFTTEHALETVPSGQTTTWRNPDSGNSGSVTPIRTYQEAGSGEFCREFEQSVNVGGQRQRGFGTACRQPDGSWRIVS